MCRLRTVPASPTEPTSLDSLYFLQVPILRTTALTGLQLSHLQSTLRTVAARGILLQHSSDHVILLLSTRQWHPTVIRRLTLASKAPWVRPHFPPPLTLPTAGQSFQTPLIPRTHPLLSSCSDFGHAVPSLSSLPIANLFNCPFLQMRTWRLREA